LPRVSFLPADHEPSRPPPVISVEDFLSSLTAQLGQKTGILTHTGRAAMHALFRHLGLERQDEVFISTTFDYPNVSSCVTCTVFNYCKPSRVLTAQTKAVFIIHEFGVPHPGTPELRDEASRRGIPLIEDCAHTVDSFVPGKWHVGAFADWGIVTFPKISPARQGGMLIGPPVEYAPTPMEHQEMRAGAEAAAAWWPSHAEQVRRRRAVYAELAERCAGYGIRPLFDLEPGVTPWFFPVHANNSEAFLQAGRERGVDCGLWHGSDVVVFPCHQYLTAADQDLILESLAAGAGSS